MDNICLSNPILPLIPTVGTPNETNKVQAKSCVKIVKSNQLGNAEHLQIKEKSKTIKSYEKNTNTCIVHEIYPSNSGTPTSTQSLKQKSEDKISSPLKGSSGDVILKDGTNLSLNSSANDKSNHKKKSSVR